MEVKNNFDFFVIVVFITRILVFKAIYSRLTNQLISVECKFIY